ncbi:hypothetical protein VP01_13934g1, partial [Puccinia sorghi]
EAAHHESFSNQPSMLQLSIHDNSHLGFGNNDENSDYERDFCLDWESFFLDILSDGNIGPIKDLHIYDASTLSDVLMSEEAWYPFPCEEAVVASLILGRFHNIMSRSIYLQVQSSLSMF